MAGGRRPSSPPIPSYEEAVAGRPSSSTHLGPSEVSHDAERQGLLAYDDDNEAGGPSSSSSSRQRRSNYRQPTVESARSSMDFLGASSSGSSPRNSDEGLRREMAEFEVLEPPRSFSSSPMGARLSKQIASLRTRVSAFNLPSFARYLPSLPRSPRDCTLPPWPESLRPSGILVVRFMGLALVIGIGWLLFFSDILRLRATRTGMSVNLEEVRHHIITHLNDTRVRENLEHASRFPHVAGTEGSYFVGMWLREQMESAMLEDVTMEQFDVYLNYPTKDGRRVAIVEPEDKRFEAKIEEGKAYPDGREQSWVFHGHSKSGNVTGPLVYANYGSNEDFKTLEDMGISVKDAIVLVRYYGTQGDRALKIKAAELAGAAGCIIYSDPNEDGFRKGKARPDGPWRPEDSVQRGGVSLMSWVVGDPLSPGFASTPNEGKRISKEDNPALVNIPSIPLAWRDAQPLLQALKGHGKKLKDKGWIGGVPDVSEWWTGDAKSPKVNLANVQDEIERRPIYNVLGRIEGLEQPEKTVTIGNHYDSWCFGASDPGSGTAILVEVLRIFGELKLMGWRPRRTLQFAFWDGEEYNLVGSTEHVEKRIEDLRRDGYAYVNLDTAVAGSDFFADGSPPLQRALLGTLNHVMDPASGKTMQQAWKDHKKHLGGLGAGSDFVAFQDLAGVSSIDLGFVGKGGAQTPAYHSCYDTYEAVLRFFDPDFSLHRAAAQVVALLALALADEPILPFDLKAYASAVGGYIDDLEAYAKDKLKAVGGSGKAKRREKNEKAKALNVRPLREAHQLMVANTKTFHSFENIWFRMVEEMNGFESGVMTVDRMKYNSKMATFETDLLDIDGGLPGREQFKHVIFAPQAWSGYDSAFFPGVRDALDADDWEGAQREVEKVADIITKASKKLVSD